MEQPQQSLRRHPQRNQSKNGPNLNMYRDQSIQQTMHRTYQHMFRRRFQVPVMNTFRREIRRKRMIWRALRAS